MGKKSASSRTIIIKFSLTRNKALAAMAGVLLCVTAVDLGCETLTLTTYYPAPYGVYSKMRVTNYSQSGPTGQVIRTGDIAGLSGVPGGARGIYAEGAGRDLVMGSVRDTRNQPARDAWIRPARDAQIRPVRDVWLRPSRDAWIQPTRRLVLNPQANKIEFGPNVYIKEFCKWVPYLTGAGRKTYCNGTPGPSQGWSVFMSANSLGQSSTAFVRDADYAVNGITHAVFVMSTTGKMLCCRGQTP